MLPTTDWDKTFVLGSMQSTIYFLGFCKNFLNFDNFFFGPYYGQKGFKDIHIEV